MKKLLFIIVIISLILGCLLISCDKQPNDQSEKDSYLNGEAVSSPIEKGNFVVYVKPSNDAVWASWDYENWCVKDENSALDYSVYFFPVDKLFASVDELKDSTELTEGMKVGVKSYYAGLGKGAAIYEIVNEKSTEMGTQTLEGTSLFAKLLPFEVNGEKIVTVDQFGTYGNGENDDYRKLNIALKYKNATVVEFESKVYLHKNTVTLARSNVRVNAKGAELHNSYKSGTVNFDFLVDGSIDKRIENVIVENLTILCTETNGKGSLYNDRDHFQFEAQYTKNFTLRNCKFVVPEYQNLKTDLHVTSVSLRHGIDTLVEGNTIENFCGSKAYSGGLWIWSDPEFKTISKNIIVRNNYIEKTSHDEVFAFFMGEFDNVIVENNTILTHDEPIGDASAHAIGFGVYDVPTTIKNVVFSNNTVDVVCKNDMMMFSNVENIEIFDNTIIARNNSKSEPITYGVFRVTFLEKNYTSAGIPDPKQTNVNIYNNKITVYNTKKVPLYDPSCGDGFNFHDNEFTCIVE